MGNQVDAITELCTACGASLSLAHHGRARCVFCLHEQALPTHIATPLREVAALSRQLDEAHAEAKKWGGGRWAMVALLLIILPGAGFMLLFGVSSFAHTGADSLRAAMTGIIAIGGTLPVIAIPLLWIWIKRRTRVRVLAGLPPSVARLHGDQLISGCPSCGAQHQPTGELTVRCSYCQTEALLPLPMVGRRLAKQHRAVLEAKRRGEAEADAAQAAVTSWQTIVVPIIFGFCTLFGVVLMVFILLAKAAQP